MHPPPCAHSLPGPLPSKALLRCFYDQAQANQVRALSKHKPGSRHQLGDLLRLGELTRLPNRHQTLGDRLLPTTVPHDDMKPLT
jgi:hypothetical protein